MNKLIKLSVVAVGLVSLVILITSYSQSNSLRDNDLSQDITSSLLRLQNKLVEAQSSPRWRVGDCVQSQDFEDFEIPLPIYKIKKIGKKKYLTNEWTFSSQKEGFLIEDVAYDFSMLEAVSYQRAKCPTNNAR